MYHSNTTYSGITTNGKQAFGQSSITQYAGDYILNKKAKLMMCNSRMCLPKTPTVTQSNYLLFKKANYIKYGRGSNKNNLVSGLTTTIDLLNVPVIQNTSGESPTTISTSVIPYLTYAIDPFGNLFGNSICGINNFQNYVIQNKP